MNGIGHPLSCRLVFNGSRVENRVQAHVVSYSPFGFIAGFYYSRSSALFFLCVLFTPSERGECPSALASFRYVLLYLPLPSEPIRRAFSPAASIGAIVLLLMKFGDRTEGFKGRLAMNLRVR